MQLAATVIIGILNVLLLLAGVANSGPQLLSRPSIETLVAFLVVTLPFAATALFASGRRSKVVWLVGTGLNVLTVVAMLAMLVFLPQGVGSGALAGGIAVAGIFSTINVAYLIWRTPKSPSKLQTPSAT